MRRSHNLESADASLLRLASNVLDESLDRVRDLPLDLINHRVASAHLLVLENNSDLVKELNKGRIDVDLDILLTLSEALHEEGSGSIKDLPKL